MLGTYYYCIILHIISLCTILTVITMSVYYVTTYFYCTYLLLYV